MNRYLLTLLLTIWSLQPVLADVSGVFRNPDDFNAKLWCFWYWMYGAVTKEGITTDLEAMKQNGLGGTYLMPIKSKEMNPALGGTVSQLSPQWYEMVDWAMREYNGQRFGLCGKTVDSCVKNLVSPYLNTGYARQRYALKWRRTDKVLEVRRGSA